MLSNLRVVIEISINHTKQTASFILNDDCGMQLACCGICISGPILNDISSCGSTSINLFTTNLRVAILVVTVRIDWVLSVTAYHVHDTIYKLLALVTSRLPCFRTCHGSKLAQVAQSLVGDSRIVVSTYSAGGALRSKDQNANTTQQYRQEKSHCPG